MKGGTQSQGALIAYYQPSAMYTDECTGIGEAGKNAYATKYVEQSSHEVLTVTYAAQWT